MQHLIKLALVALASVAAFFVYGFTALVAPWYIAAAAALSLVGTYIGLAFAAIPKHQRERAQWVAWGAMLIEAIYGTLYVLSVERPALFVAPPLAADIAISILHGAAFSVLAFFVSLFVVHGQSEEPTSIADEVANKVVAILPSPMLALPKQEHYPAPVVMAPQAVATTSEAAQIYACEHCGSTLTMGQYGAMRRYGKCKHCPRIGA